ncbi:MAG: type II toxin-antitoxin system ParD family antitoxin [Chloroflexi bacterium]|nr:type II toxin-antitoxin system ParD family antitoxin [Chloroflexota bacterium]
MNILLTEYWQGYVAGPIRRGRYQNASELMREALRLHEREQMARDVSEVEALFGATGRAEGAAKIEQIESGDSSNGRLRLRPENTHRARNRNPGRKTSKIACTSSGG